MRRLDSALLSGAGVLSVHQMAYVFSAATGLEPEIGHGHLAIAWLVASIAAIGGLGLAILRSLCSRKYSPPGVALLSIWILSGYVAMEAAERSLDDLGMESLLSESVFWLGLLATPPVAFLLRWSVRSAVGAAARISQVGRRAFWPFIPPLSFGITTVDLVPLLLRSHAVSRRGPPVRRNI